MKGRRTQYSKTKLRTEILYRMAALDTSEEEYTDFDLVRDYEELIRRKK